MLKRYFDDLAEGEKLDCADVIFTRNGIIKFAKQFDPQPFHVAYSRILDLALRNPYGKYQ